ncbi:MFS transporter [soil metagenome]
MLTPKKEKILLFILAIIQFTVIMDFMIMMPLGPQLMRIFDIDPHQFGMIVSSYTFAAGIVGFISAFYIDKFDRKNALFYNYIGFSIGTILCAMAPTYFLLVTARIFTGVFGGVMGAIVMSIVGDVIPEERRGTAMGIIMASFSAASVAGVPAGLYFATLFGWHAPFYILGFLGLIISGTIYFVIPNIRYHLEKAHGEKLGPLRVLKDIFTDKNQVTALTFISLLIIGQFTIIPFISPYLVSNVGFSEQQLTWIYICGGAATILTNPWIGRLSDKYGKIKVFNVILLVSLLPLFTTTHMPRISIYIVLAFSTLFFITIGGRMVPAMTMITSTVKPQHRGGFMSIVSSVMQLSSGLSSFVAGYIVTKEAGGELQNFDIIGYIAIAASLVTLFFVRKIKVVTNEDEVLPAEARKRLEMEFVQSEMV